MVSDGILLHFEFPCVAGAFILIQVGIYIMSNELVGQPARLFGGTSLDKIFLFSFSLCFCFCCWMILREYIFGMEA